MAGTTNTQHSWASPIQTHLGETAVQVGKIPDNGRAAVSAAREQLAVAFDLTGYDPSTAVLTGDWAADQFGHIVLNGRTPAFPCPTAAGAAARAPRSSNKPTVRESCHELSPTMVRTAGARAFLSGRL